MTPSVSVDIDLGVEDGAPAATGVDFQRPVHALLGLPFDAVDMAAAVTAVRAAAFASTPYMVSTPNLNFVVGALSDPAFRASVANSDLSLVDGMPLVWVARLLGVPMRERVSGANLFEALAAHPEPPLATFFFGGADGVAHAACQRVNATARGMRCVGFAAPGFGTVEQMSGESYISRINACAPQFVVAALGAKKGQAWLQRNRLRLHAPVRCHLGAVVNFAAGTVRRAPPLVQRTGLEWLWRIVQEPALWRRYAGDGWAFVRLLAGSVLPLAWGRRSDRVPADAWAQASLVRTVTGATCTLALSGPWAERNLQPLRDALAQAAHDAHALRLDVSDVSHVDTAFIGLLMLAPRAFPGGVEWVGAMPALVRTLRRHRADWLLVPTAGGPHA